MKILDYYLMYGRLEEFVRNVLEADVEDMTWDYYLHKVYDQSYEDFKRQMKEKSKTKEEKEHEAEEALRNNYDIFNVFNEQSEVMSK